MTSSSKRIHICRRYNARKWKIDKSSNDVLIFLLKIDIFWVYQAVYKDMGQGLCADSQGKVVDYYGDSHHVNGEQCEQYCNEMGQPCVGYSDFDLGGACLLHVSEETLPPEGFIHFQEISNEAQSVETVNTVGNQFGYSKIDFSCFKKMSNYIFFNHYQWVRKTLTLWK